MLACLISTWVFFFFFPYFFLSLISVAFDLGHAQLLSAAIPEKCHFKKKIVTGRARTCAPTIQARDLPLS